MLRLAIVSSPVTAWQWLREMCRQYHFPYRSGNVATWWWDGRRSDNTALQSIHINSYDTAGKWLNMGDAVQLRQERRTFTVTGVIYTNGASYKTTSVVCFSSSANIIELAVGCIQKNSTSTNPPHESMSNLISINEWEFQRCTHAPITNETGTKICAPPKDIGMRVDILRNRNNHWIECR